MINKILKENEKVIYTSKANPEKISMQIFRFVLIGIVLTVFYYLLFIGYGRMEVFNWIACLVMLFLLSVLTIYGLIYNVLLKHRAKDEVYYITDKRIILINGNKVLYNDTVKVSAIGIAREKNSFGNITFHFSVDMNNALESLINNQQDVKSITFSGIKNPREVVEIIKKYNKDVYIYDDRPKLLSNKM